MWRLLDSLHPWAIPELTSHCNTGRQRHAVIDLGYGRDCLSHRNYGTYLQDCLSHRNYGTYLQDCHDTNCVWPSCQIGLDYPGAQQGKYTMFSSAVSTGVQSRLKRERFEHMVRGQSMEARFMHERSLV